LLSKDLKIKIYRTIILPVVLYGCETWLLTSREEHRLRGEGCTGFWGGNLRERDQWGDPDIDGRIILGLIFRKWEGVVGTG